MFFLLGQSVSDIQRAKQQYENFLLDQQRSSLSSDIDVIDQIDGDIPITEEIGFKYYEKDIDESELQELMFFGYDFFNMRDTVAIWNNLPIPSSYKLGPGDEIIISLWGETQLRDNYTIGRDGTVYIKRVGQLNLTGKSMEQAKKYLEKQFQKVYETLKGSQPSSYLDVSLGKLKSINVTFVGEVKFPGIHPVHPFSTALTGLIQAGGIDTVGSLRNIQIIRSESNLYNVDLYKFLLFGQTDDANKRLQDNDVIFIPPRSSRVEIIGAVKRPGIYEVRDSDNLGDIVDFAGGLRSNANNNLLVHYNYPNSNNNKPRLEYVPYSDANKIFDDNIKRIKVYTVPDYNKSIYIYGQVKNPGSYGFEKGMHILDLLNMVGGLFDKTFYKTIYAPRADIIRRDFKSSFPKVIPINLEELKQGNTTQNIELHNWDIVFVRKNKNFTIPKQVKITGEVNIPGFYTLSKPRETLDDLLSRAGGFTDRAFKDGIQLYRDTMQVALDNFNFSLTHKDSIYVPDFPGVVQVLGEVYKPGYVQYQKRKRLKSYIEAAGGFTLDARKKYITIIQPNGDVKVKDSFWTPRVKEGALIIIHKERKKLPFDVTSFLKDAASIAASLTTIIYIINSQSNG